MKAESKLQSDIIKYLNSLDGCYAIKVITGNLRGIADILCCYNGKFIAFEIKRQDGKESKIQAAHRRMIIAAKGKSEVVRTLDEVKESLLWH
jgi:Holliday junction resolvase